MRCQGFVLVVTLVVFTVLSLVIIAGFEQAQWVQKGNYALWQQIKLRDGVWQQLRVAENNLPTYRKTSQCFQAYSLTNDYFFKSMPSVLASCRHEHASIEFAMVYEQVMQGICRDISHPNQAIGIYRLTVQAKSKIYGQKMTLQAVEVMTWIEYNNNKTPNVGLNCSKYTHYGLERQSWLLQ